MKFRDYPEVVSTSDSDVFLLDRNGYGTRRIQAGNMFKPDADILDKIATPQMRRILFRGNNLGSSVSSTQIANIRNGTFKGLFLGDYWTINGRNWRIADFDYWKHVGRFSESGSTNPSHVMIVPDSYLDSSSGTKWHNATDIRSVGYANSYMRKTGLANALNVIEPAFPNLVLTFNQKLCSGLPGGSYESGNVNVNSKVELMTESMIWGFTTSTPKLTTDYNKPFTTTPVGLGSYQFPTQLALFAVDPNYISINKRYWTRDIFGATANQASIVAVEYDGSPTQSEANGNWPAVIRPVFAIG